MSTPKTAKMSTSVTHYSDIDLSCQHVTTSNFMEFNVAKAMELVPKQSIRIDMRTFARLAPMPVPTFGNAEIHNRAYFVPYRTVMRGWNEFIEDVPFVNSSGDAVVPVVPQISNYEFMQCLRSTSFSTHITNGSAYDFVVYDYQGTASYRRFTPLGKRAYKLLLSLGYRISFDYRSTMFHSALPLLSLLRVYYDYYYPTAYAEDDRAISIKRWFEFTPTDDPADFSDAFDGQTIEEMLTYIASVAYDSDYFTSAWDNPVAPNNGTYSSINISDPTSSNPNYNIGGLNSQNGTPEINANSTLTQFAVDALKSVTDYMKRHQIAGARVLTRYLSRWGIKLPDVALNRSVWIGESIDKLRFGDVTSTADTNGENLGAYAGKGIGDNLQENFVEFSTNEFGCLIIVSTFVPKVAYYQGQDRFTFHSSRFDFYTPEFDNLGVQALATRELYVPTLALSQPDAERGIDYDRAVFGFVPRYGEYKRGYDNMTGDYVLPSKNVGKEGWTLMRDVSSYFERDGNTQYESVVHSRDFVDGKDKEQFNRIFYVTDNVEDKINVIHNFVIKTRFPGRSLYDSYEFKEEDKAQKVNIEVNGVRAN